MARPIKEIPILFGEDARRFEERMKNPPKQTPEEIAQIKRDYEYMMSMFERKKQALCQNLQTRPSSTAFASIAL